MYNGIDYSVVFEPNYYINKYSDLKNAFGTDIIKLFNHFCTYGMKEGRQAIESFNVQAYKNQERIWICSAPSIKKRRRWCK